MPDGACDCHAHVFGPATLYPMVPDRLYTPPAAPLPAYERLLATLGFQRAVIVQPSVYGTDNRATLDAVAAAPDRMRAVVVVDGRVTRDRIAAYHRQGARGVRLNLLFSGQQVFAEMRTIAGMIAEFGWHVQVLLDVSALPDLPGFLSGLPVPVVFDHMGHVRPEKGIDEPGFRAMLRMMEAGTAWAKLSGAYRVSSAPEAPYDDVSLLAKAIFAANPGRVVFGTDWPHPHISVAMPNDGALLDQLADWVPDPCARRKVLVENPARLYDF